METQSSPANQIVHHYNHYPLYYQQQPQQQQQLLLLHGVNSMSSTTSTATTTSSLSSSPNNQDCGNGNNAGSGVGGDGCATPGCTNLIVNYLPQTMTENELRSLFEQIDYVERCKLVTNRWTNQSLCYGFVKYTKADSADRAVKSLNGLKLENKIIKVGQFHT